MVGAIRKRDILAHPVVTIRCFGWAVFLRAVTAPPGQTFLSLVAASEAPAAPKKPWREPIEQCCRLELRAEAVYRSFAERFAANGPASDFFTALANQEREHHDLLQLCAAAMRRGHWKSELFDPWRKSLPALETHMHSAEKSARLLTDLEEALELVLALECSEVNFVFRGAVLATDSEFVRRLKAFDRAGANHLAYIAWRLPELAPSLAAACDPLLDARHKLAPARA